MLETKPKKLFNIHFISITVINFIVYLVYYLLMVIIAVIAQENLHATLGEAGLATGIYIIGTLLARLYMGKMLELIGRKQVLRYGALFYLLTTIAYIYMPSIVIMYIVRFLNGFGYGTVSTATNAIVTSYIPENKEGEGINYYGLSTSLAAGIGPFIGILLLNISNFNVIIKLSIFLIILVTISSFLFPVKNIKLTKKYRESLAKWNLDSFIEKKVLFITFIAFLMGFSYSSVLAFLSSYVKTINLVYISTFFFIIYAVVITLTRPFTGRIFDTKGEKYVMYPSYFFLALGLFLLSNTSTGFMLLLSGGLIGLGYGTFMSNGQAVCLQESPGQHRIGISLSTYFIGLDLGLGVGPYILGELRQFLTFKEMYLLSASIPIFCLFLYLIVRKSRN